MKSFARSSARKTKAEDSLDDGGLAALYAEGGSGDSLERTDEMTSEKQRSDVTGRFGVESAMSDRTLEGNGGARSTEDWKAKYMELKAEYEALLQDYEALLADRAASAETRTSPSAIPQSVKDELAAKDNRIRSLEDQLAAAAANKSQPSPQPNPQPSPQPSPHSSQQIEALNEEIQKLLEQRIELEAELADLRYGVRRGSSPQLSPASNFDQERLINNLRAQLREKDEEIDELQGELNAAREEIGRLGGVVGIVATQVERAEKKKKKSWFGSKKKRPEDISAAKLGEIAQTATAIAGGGAAPSEIASVIGGPQDDTRSGIITVTPPHNASMTLLAPPNQSTANAARDMASVVVNKRMLELERENARLEGEIDILQKEKKAITDKLERLEAQHETLTKVMANDEHNRKAIEVSRGLIALPVPKDGGSELDRLKALVTVQEAAIQKLSIQNQQLEDNLRVYGTKQPNSAYLEQTLQALRKDYNHSQQEVTRLRHELSNAIADARSANTRATYSTTQAEQLRRSLKSVEESTRAATAKLKRQIDEQSDLIMSLMLHNEQLLRQAEKAGIDISTFRDRVALQLRATEANRAVTYPCEAPTALRPSPVVTNPDPPLPLRARCDGKVHQPPVIMDVPRIITTPATVQQPDPPVHNVPQPRPPPPPQPQPQPQPPPSEEPFRKSLSSSSMDEEEDTINFEYPREAHVYEYRWTDDGYALREASTSRAEQLRPAVTVEHRAPGPFPPEEQYYGLTDDNGGKVPLVPEVTDADRARCTVALRQWISEGRQVNNQQQQPLHASPLNPASRPVILRRVSPPKQNGIKELKTPSQPPFPIPSHPPFPKSEASDSDEETGWAPKVPLIPTKPITTAEQTTDRRQQYSPPPSFSDRTTTERAGSSILHSTSRLQSDPSNKSPSSQNEANEFDTFAPGMTKAVVSTSDSGSKGFGAIRRSARADSFSSTSPLKAAELAADRLSPPDTPKQLGDTNWLDRAPSDISDDKHLADSPNLKKAPSTGRLSRNGSSESKALLRNESKNSGDFRLFRDQEGTLIDDLR